jgi:hypothetical protein
LDSMTQKETFELEQAQFEKAQRDADLEIARLNYDEARYTLRILEVAAGLTALRVTV